MDQKQADEIRQKVRASYSEVAEASNSGDGCGTQSSCCGVSDDAAINTLVSTRLGYSEDEIETLKVWNVDRGKKTWEATLGLPELKAILEKFADLLVEYD